MVDQLSMVGGEKRKPAGRSAGCRKFGVFGFGLSQPHVNEGSRRVFGDGIA
jgi:hypothetical protein